MGTYEFETIADDLGFIEGPVVSISGDILVTSIDRGLVYAVSPDGSVEVRAKTGGGPNGLVEDAEGGLYIAQNGGCWPAEPALELGGGLQFSPNGETHTRFLAREPISPNDLCFDPNGDVLITDPTRDHRRDDGRLWRYSVEEERLDFLGTVGWYPNGIGFGEDEESFLIADTGGARLVRCAIADERVAELETFATLKRGRPDGFAYDNNGNVVVACVEVDSELFGTAQVFDRDGELVEVIELGERRLYTNLAISPDGQLFLCDSEGGKLIACKWPYTGLKLFPHRTVVTNDKGNRQ